MRLRSSKIWGDRVPDFRERGRHLYGRENHTIRNIISFVAGVGVAMLCAPRSGKEVRDPIGERAKGMSNRVRNRIAPRKTVTGTEAT
jgi:hypothetical protein